MSTIQLTGKAWAAFEGTQVAPQTKNLYRWWVVRFLDYCKVESPDALLTIGATPQEVEDKVIEWLQSMEGKATATLKGALNSVVFFYSANRLKLDSKFIARRIPKKPGIPHRAPTKEELVQMCDTVDIRGKAIISLLASTGMRVGGLAPLRLRHIRRLTEQELEHRDCNCENREEPLKFTGYLIQVYDGEPESHFTLCSPEAAKYLDLYLAMRKRSGEELGPDSPLIREAFDPTEKDKPARPISEGVLKTWMARVAATSGVKPVLKPSKGKHTGSLRQAWKNMHGYRQFFSTAAINAGMGFHQKEICMGHKLNLEPSYYDSRNPRSVHAVLAQYMKAVEAFSLYSTAVLELENKRLKDKIDTDIEELRAEVRGLASFGELAQQTRDNALVENERLKAEIEKLKGQE